MSNSTENHSHVLFNAVRLAGEALVLPGTSQLLDGKLGSGALHAVAGVAARSVFGPAGWLLVAANSYAKSSSGASLLERISNRSKAAQEQPAAETAPPEGAAE